MMCTARFLLIDSVDEAKKDSDKLRNVIETPLRQLNGPLHCSEFGLTNVLYIQFLKVSNN